MRDRKLYTILDDIGIKTATFTAAVTDIITSTAHGLKNGDKVILTTDGTLPAGLELLIVHYVVEAATNTFKLSITSGTEGAPIDVTDTGSGTHTWTMHDVGNSIYVEEFRNVIFALNTDGGADAALTVKFQGSIQEDAPDFSAAQSVSNQWDFIQVKDLEDGSTIDGDTGIAAAAGDQNRHAEANINALRWVNAIISGWTVGEVTVKALLTDNE